MNIDHNRIYYEQNAKEWSDTKTHSFWQEDQFRQFVKYLKKGNTVLDIGSAWGIHVPLFLGIGRNLKYEGMDISTNMISIARRRFPQLKFYEADVSKRKELPKKKYNAFWASAVLMHVDESDWDSMLFNIESVIKPGGVGYMTLPKRRPNKSFKNDKRSFSYWTPKKAEKYFEDRGWKIIEAGNMPARTAGWLWVLVRLP